MPGHEHSSSCNRGNKGLLRMSGMHIEFCDGQSWVQLLDKNVSLKSSAGLWCSATLKGVQNCLSLYLCGYLLTKLI